MFAIACPAFLFLRPLDSHPFRCKNLHTNSRNQLG